MWRTIFRSGRSPALSIARHGTRFRCESVKQRGAVSTCSTPMTSRRRFSPSAGLRSASPALFATSSSAAMNWRATATITPRSTTRAEKNSAQTSARPKPCLRTCQASRSKAIAPPASPSAPKRPGRMTFSPKRATPILPARIRSPMTITAIRRRRKRLSGLSPVRR